MSIKTNKKDKSLDLSNYLINTIKSGIKVKGKIIKKVEDGVLVNCEDYGFTGIILSKEVKDLEKGGFDLNVGKNLDAELLNINIRDEEGYFTLSISKLLQYDIWNDIMNKYKNDEVIKVVPNDANLGGLLIDMHGIKGFIPLSQLAPVNYPRVEDGDSEKIFDCLTKLMYKEFSVRILNIDEDGRRLILSEREALKEERDNILKDLDIGNIYEGVISGISSYGLFVTIGGGIEGLVHISEITYGHVDNITKFGKVGDRVKVKVIGNEVGKISFSFKKLKEDPWVVIPRDYKPGDFIDGVIIRFVPYGVFIRVFDDINGLVHLSELNETSLSNPAEVLKIGDKVQTKIILIDPEKRKIGLSLKSYLEELQAKKGLVGKKTIEKKQDKSSE